MNEIWKVSYKLIISIIIAYFQIQNGSVTKFQNNHIFNTWIFGFITACIFDNTFQ